MRQTQDMKYFPTDYIFHDRNPPFKLITIEALPL
jgi:hypothetical protein